MQRFRSLVARALVLSFLMIANPVQARERINVVYASISGLFLASWVAQEGGYFAKEDLDVNLVYIQSATVAIQSMLAGEAPIALAGGEPLSNRVSKAATLFSSAEYPSFRRCTLWLCRR